MLNIISASRDSPGSPETDSGSESLKVSLGSGGGGGVNMPEAAASQDSHLSSLTNSLKVTQTLKVKLLFLLTSIMYPRTR